MKRILIIGGRVIDPANNTDKVTNLIIEKGKILDLTDEAPVADQVIRAEGKIVSPGFIDMHIHEDPYDEASDSLDDSIGLSMLKMGVTTAIGGNCGINKADPVKYLDTVDRDGAPVNIGLLAGHTYIRESCGGLDKYAAVDRQVLKCMAKKTKTFLEAGCFGVSLGVKYVPGSTAEEIETVASGCKQEEKIIASHVRYDVERVFEAVKELADLGQKLEVPVQVSHIGSMGGYGQMEDLLAQMEWRQRKGVDISCDCYPYLAFSTMIGETTYDEGFLASYQSDYDSILICDGKYTGQRCTEAIFRELRETAPKTTTVGYFMKEKDVDMALLWPHTIVASDGLRNGPHGHPRAAGTFPRFICEYVKSGKIDLMTAVSKMTVMPAERMGIKDKGYLSRGADADVVIFDYDRIKDKATYEEPALPPEGIDYVLMGGEVAVREGKLINGKLGKPIRK